MHRRHAVTVLRGNCVISWNRARVVLRVSHSALDAEDQDQEVTPYPLRAKIPTRVIILTSFPGLRTPFFAAWRPKVVYMLANGFGERFARARCSMTWTIDILDSISGHREKTDIPDRVHLLRHVAAVPGRREKYSPALHILDRFHIVVKNEQGLARGSRCPRPAK